MYLIDKNAPAFSKFRLAEDTNYPLALRDSSLQYLEGFRGSGRKQLKTHLAETISTMNESEQNEVCGILMAKMPSAHDAREHAKAMQDCPRSLMTGVSGDNSYAVLVVPSNKSWWLQYPQEFPEIIGALDVTVVDVNNVFLRNRNESTQNNYDSPPCGADCEKCPLRETHSCDGCPAVRS